MDSARLRYWWWARQGLDGSLAGASAAAVLERTGWMRSVGGAGPYLGLFARAGLGRLRVDEAVAAVEISELPSARSCAYVLPAGHFGLGLRTGHPGGDTAEIAMCKKHLGVTEAELQRLEAAVLEALAGEALDPTQLKGCVGDAVRNLGPEGRKRGQTTTLPLVLGRLQGEGRIRRIPLDGRLDRQRYAYIRWVPSPAAEETSAAQDALALGRLYFHWAGPATVAQFAAFAGLGAKVARSAAAELRLDAIGDRLLLPEDRAAIEAIAVPDEPRYAFLSNLDGLLLFRRELAPLFDSADAVRPLWTERGQRSGGALADLSHQAIVDRGRIVGVWDYDALAGELVWASFGRADAALRAEAARVEAWIKADLGDVRSFSLDSPESRQGRIAALRAMRG